MSRKLTITVMLGGQALSASVITLRCESWRGTPFARHKVHEVDPQDANWQLPEDTELVFLALHGTMVKMYSSTSARGVRRPYTGCDPEASRIGFDKSLTKQRLIETGVPTARFSLIDSTAASWPMGWIRGYP